MIGTLLSLALALQPTVEAGADRCLIVHRSGEPLPTDLPDACRQRYTPCSTFKLPNTLIGLETGAISGVEHRWGWDGVERRVPAWNRDHDLRSAIASSVVPYYRQVARDVGPERMAEWVERFGYGDRDVSGIPDRFWLGDSLHISAIEQVEFIQRFLDSALGVSERSADTLSDITRQSFSADHSEHGKTGWCYVDSDDGPMVSWFVGWVERKDATWLFVAMRTGDVGRADAKRDARDALEARDILP